MSEIAKQRWKDGTLSSPEVQRKRITGQRKAKRRKKAEHNASANGKRNGKPSHAEIVHVVEEAPIGRIDPVEYAALVVMGRLQSIVEEVAGGARLPRAVVAERVAELLRSATRR